MNNSIVLSKSSSNEDLKRYFTGVLELSKSDNKFPINLDEVWPLVYTSRENAFRALRRNFFEGEDYCFVQNDEVLKTNKLINGIKIDCYLSVSCLEYFIARKVRPVFEVYRKVFHKAAETSMLASYQIEDPIERAKKWIDEQEERKKLEDENRKLLDDMQSQQILTNVLQGENETLKPKARVYDEIINSQRDSNLSTTSSVANEIGMSGQKLNKMLMACGVIYKTPSGEYLFCTEYLRWNLGRLISTVVNEATGRIKTYIKWNTRGRAYIHALNDSNWDKRKAWHRLKGGKEVYAV